VSSLLDLNKFIKTQNKHECFKTSFNDRKEDVHIPGR